MARRLFAALVFLLVQPFCSVALHAKQLPLLEGMGDYQLKVTTNSVYGQRFFNQGLVLSYGFNHAVARASFAYAIELDANCAMCWWGKALVMGPHINAPMTPDDEPLAYQAIQQALKLAADPALKISSKERAFIEALAKRYGPEYSDASRQQRDAAYAQAMQAVAEQYPDDVDAQVLAVEAVMDLHPWDYWQDDEPQPWTPAMLAALEDVLSKRPDHPGANHFYIHLVEASPQPQKGEAAADRLTVLTPGVGHLAHMPAHIFIRLGRYHEASIANQRAIAADARLLAKVDVEGIYPLGYVPHNYHFLFATLILEGRSKDALVAAKRTAALVQPELKALPDDALFEHFSLLPVYAMITFGLWQEILALEQPADELVYSRGIWHFARGMAYLRSGETDSGKEELLQLITLNTGERKIWGINLTNELLLIATDILSAEMTAAAGNYRGALAQLEQAVAREDSLIYIEPPDWLPPTRLYWGRLLLDAGKPELAERAFRELLDKFPKNGWALFGLLKSLEAQGNEQAAAITRRQFKEAWRHADIELQAPSF